MFLCDEREAGVGAAPWACCLLGVDCVWACSVTPAAWPRLQVGG